jgi:hypothetical protein
MKVSPSKLPEYKTFKRAVQRNDLEGMRSLASTLESLGVSLPSLSGRALEWAAAAGSLLAFRELLTPAWKALRPNDDILVRLIRQTEPDTLAESVFPALIQALQQAGVALESTAYTTQPLEEAVFRQHFKVIKALLEAGADPEGLYRWKEGSTGSYGTSPLCSAKTIEIVDLLLRHGANPGSASSGSGHGMFGGVYTVLSEWKNRSELPRLWNTMVANGVGPETLVEESGLSESTLSLASAVFERRPSESFVQRMQKTVLGASFQKKHEERLQQRAEIQELLVSQGFDLSGLASDGRTWGEHVLEHGSSRLARLVRLDKHLPAPTIRRPGPRF